VNSTDRVSEKIYAAVNCLCGKDTFEKRWQNATEAGLSELNEDDLIGPLREDLRYILSWTKAGANQPNDIERSRLVEKMLHVLLVSRDTHPNQAPNLGDCTGFGATLWSVNSLE
jgi:hypothetical protein